MQAVAESEVYSVSAHQEITDLNGLLHSLVGDLSTGKPLAHLYIVFVVAIYTQSVIRTQTLFHISFYNFQSIQFAYYNPLLVVCRVAGYNF